MVKPTEPKKKRNPSPEALFAVENFDRLPDCSRVRISVLTKLFGCSTPTIWRRVKSGQLSAPREGTWGVGEIRSYLNALSSAA